MGYHYINVNNSDFTYDVVGDIINVQEGDICPCCGGHLYFKKGIEVGNLFKLGTKYASKLGLTYLDENNQEKVVTMGCYGIGVGRILASIIEQNNDEHGMILPMNIAPYEVAIVLINNQDEKALQVADQIYHDFQKEGIEVLLDDRDERPGVKFKDMDLIGIPLRVVVGKKVNDNLLEVKRRACTETQDIACQDIVKFVKDYVQKEKK